MRRNLKILLPILLWLFSGCDESIRGRGKTIQVKLSPRSQDLPRIEEILDQPSNGELIYIPVYSSIYEGSQHMEYPLTVTLSIRNTDPQNPIVVKYASYYNTEGDLIREFIESPILLNPLQTREVVIERSDAEGGTGANFLVTWYGKGLLSPPLIEAITLSYSLHASFVSHGQVVQVYDSALNDFRYSD